MKIMSALEAKNSFGKFLDAAQREPVTVTKNSREVATMLSTSDLNLMAEAYLAEPYKNRVESGELNLVDALMKQAKINKRIELAEQSISAGQGIVADEAYFDGLRARIKSRTQ